MEEKIYGRCMKCGKSVEILELVVEKTKNGRRMAKGKCACGCTVCKFLKKEE